MDAEQNLYYALGILAYAIAKADGTVQKEERQRIHDIVEKETKHNINFNYSEIIFDILQKDNRSFSQVYEWAINEFELGKYHLTEDMKKKFKNVIQQIAEAFPPDTDEEKELISKFGEDLKKLDTTLPIS